MDDIREIDFQRRIISDEGYEPFKIVFYYNGKNVLFGFNAHGETGFSQYGLDIVAAGVSTLIINTINSLRLLTNEPVEAEIKRNYAKCILPNLRNNKLSKEAHILLKSLKMGIESIQENYGEKYVLIEELREENKGSIFNIFKLP
ncbi:ribosomal-processing cysteine protease Prp [Paenibacillus hamazuiensis]|uniref:ribosomal-processing cysteine protease Prp n=1 Tax=Paenibacillus hamazuiensis TaxID=2936508 RepID=UPI00200EE99A|nr:ribosomal-processing cysteine protease Prp [Paenibacillus hamazuiensis]